MGSTSPGKEEGGKDIRLQADKPNRQTQTNKKPVAQGERFKRIFMVPHLLQLAQIVKEDCTGSSRIDEVCSVRRVDISPWGAGCQIRTADRNRFAIRQLKGLRRDD